MMNFYLLQTLVNLDEFQLSNKRISKVYFQRFMQQIFQSIVYGIEVKHRTFYLQVLENLHYFDNFDNFFVIGDIFI